MEEKYFFLNLLINKSTNFLLPENPLFSVAPNQAPQIVGEFYASENIRI